MAKFSQEFKSEAVKKVLSKTTNQTTKEIAHALGIGYSTLQKWIRLAKDNQLEAIENNMTTDKSPQHWTKSERLEAIMDCHPLNETERNSYCRTKGIYAHHLAQWKKEFLLEKPTDDNPSKQTRKKLSNENKRLQKELNRKDKALAETAALLVLSKKCQAIWAENEDV